MLSIIVERAGCLALVARASLCLSFLAHSSLLDQSNLPGRLLLFLWEPRERFSPNASSERLGEAAL